MLLKRIAPAIVRGTAEYLKQKNWGQRAVLAFLAALTALVMVALVSDLATEAAERYKFNHLSPTIHLNLARAACGTSVGTETQDCISTTEAKRQLLAIPRSAAEWETASKLLSSIQDQETRIKEAIRANENYAQTLSHDQMNRNVNGLAHDDFVCGISAEGREMVSFDQGRFWWTDDGRCWARQQQRSRDADAETSSYVPTTLRVDTDMDSFWLPDEERTCQSYPDDKGKVSIVGCNPTGSHRDHNIPVRFWGGVERNTVSNWRCRREKNLLRDEFVCRAID